MLDLHGHGTVEGPYTSTTDSLYDETRLDADVGTVLCSAD